MESAWRVVKLLPLLLAVGACVIAALFVPQYRKVRRGRTHVRSSPNRPLALPAEEQRRVG